MVWGFKKSAAPPPIPEPKQPEQSPDQIISEMLSAYQQHFYEKAKGQPDPAIAQAKAVFLEIIAVTALAPLCPCSWLPPARHPIRQMKISCSGAASRPPWTDA